MNTGPKSKNENGAVPSPNFAMPFSDSPITRQQQENPMSVSTMMHSRPATFAEFIQLPQFEGEYTRLFDSLADRNNDLPIDAHEFDALHNYDERGDGELVFSVEILSQQFAYAGKFLESVVNAYKAQQTGEIEWIPFTCRTSQGPEHSGLFHWSHGLMTVEVNGSRQTSYVGNNRKNAIKSRNSILRMMVLYGEEA